jgi:hypothetical protein
MNRWYVVAAVSLWAGVTLLLSSLRWFSRTSLADRVSPYLPGGATTSSRAARGSVRDVVGPIARRVGERLATTAGVREPLAIRLERIHADVDVTAFRLRQVGGAVAGLAVAVAIGFVVRPPAVVGALMIVAAPLLAFLLVEQRVARQSTDWQRRLQAELPVVTEQIGMLLAAGWSVGGALSRIAARGSGCCARDLRRVTSRIRHGLSAADALAEWAAVARLDAVDRLVSILALSRDTADIGHLISEEARSIRKTTHRALLELLDRRAQTVWIPVTVAALVPGALFLAVPFLEVMRVFGAS